MSSLDDALEVNMNDVRPLHPEAMGPDPLEAIRAVSFLSHGHIRNGIAPDGGSRTDAPNAVVRKSDCRGAGAEEARPSRAAVRQHA